MKMKNYLVIALLLVGFNLTAFAALCVYDRYKTQYCANTCTNPNTPCTYGQYITSFYTCQNVVQDGHYKNCINQNEQIACETIIGGDCNDGICEGGTATGVFSTNWVQTVYSSIVCPPPG